MKKRFREKDDYGNYVMTPLEKEALIYLIKHSKIVKLKRSAHLYTVYINGKLIPDIVLSEHFIVCILLDIYDLEVKIYE